jgi:hypothetical protein
MSEKPKISLSFVELTAIGARLTERADQIHQITLAELVLDLRLAAQVCGRLADVRAEISEIATKCKDPDAARELRDLLDAVAVEEVG